MLSVSVNYSCQLLNAWSNLYENLYVCHATRARICIYFPPIFARQRLCQQVPVATNTHKSIRTADCVIFFAIRALSKEILCVCLYISLSLQDSNSVKIVPRQRRIVGGIVLYAIRVVWKENMWLFLSRNSCVFMSNNLYRIISKFTIDVHTTRISLSAVLQFVSS